MLIMMPTLMSIRLLKLDSTNILWIIKDLQLTITMHMNQHSEGQSDLSLYPNHLIECLSDSFFFDLMLIFPHCPLTISEVGLR